jgi:hypothetical protein
MNPGDQVTIYYDPFTCKQPEGKATLIKRISVIPHILERWEVRFEAQKITRCRNLKKEEQ